MEYSEKNEIVIVDKNENVKSTDYGYPLLQKSLLYGGISGLVMVFISIVIGATAGVENAGWDYLKYIILGLALGHQLNNYKTYLPSGKIFKDGLVAGTYTSIIAALVMSGVDFLVSLTGFETSFANKFRLDTDSLGGALTVVGLSSIECVVYGLILTFVWLQLLKDPKPAE
jgi:hypothetical protein